MSAWKVKNSTNILVWNVCIAQWTLHLSFLMSTSYVWARKTNFWWKVFWAGKSLGFLMLLMLQHNGICIRSSRSPFLSTAKNKSALRVNNRWPISCVEQSLTSVGLHQETKEKCAILIQMFRICMARKQKRNSWLLITICFFWTFCWLRFICCVY